MKGGRPGVVEGARPAGGVWLLAARALGRPVPVDETYPHICGIAVGVNHDGSPVLTTPRDCAACATNGPRWPSTRGKRP